MHLLLKFIVWDVRRFRVFSCWVDRVLCRDRACHRANESDQEYSRIRERGDWCIWLWRLFNIRRVRFWNRLSRSRCFPLISSLKRLSWSPIRIVTIAVSKRPKVFVVTWGGCSWAYGARQCWTCNRLRIGLWFLLLFRSMRLPCWTGPVLRSKYPAKSNSCWIRKTPIQSRQSRTLYREHNIIQLYSSQWCMKCLLCLRSSWVWPGSVLCPNRLGGPWFRARFCTFTNRTGRLCVVLDS